VVENIKLLGEIRLVISETRKFVSRNINHAQIISNWVIGKYIVFDEQSGQKTAEYGKGVIKYLSINLEKEFGSGYSEVNLQFFRRFYLYYPNSYSASRESDDPSDQIPYAVSRDFKMAIFQQPHNKNSNRFIDSVDFFPISNLLVLNISWTHIRLTLKFENKETREFYLKESSECNWSTRALQRQINSLYYERLLSSQNKDLVRAEAEEKTKTLVPEDILKDPMLLEFLQLKNQTNYLESDLEQAILDHLSEFLLEMGKGFAFVARQKRIRTETKEFAIDLVFYNYLLKCFVLIDLKTRELEHGDIGQIDMYVRYYEENYKLEGDNSTLGIILATEKDETIVRYSILNESKNLFATKYKLYIPSEQELINEIDKTKLNYKLKN
jgi:predicted nuclease of restriction endonuclease-like (RecB) superfamily